MDKLKGILSKVFEIDEGQIVDETSSDNVETWDSFSGLILISELESKFNVRFTMDEVRQIKNVRDIVSLLTKYNVELVGK